MHLIKDSLISFATSLFIPFIKYILPTVIRIYALKNKNKIIYKISKLLQLI